MTIETKKKTIGGLRFELEQLPAFTGFQAFTRFLTIASPLLPAIVVAFKAKMAKQEVPAQVVLEGLLVHLPKALASAPPEELVSLSKLLLSTCTVVGKERVEFNEVGDELLKGRGGVLLQLLAWAVEVHFTSFFVDWLEATKGGQPAAAPAAPSSTSQTS